MNLTDLDLGPTEIKLVQRIADLSRDKFAGRADDYDRAAAFPAEDFRDLVEARLHCAAVPAGHGGLDLGLCHGVFALWMMAKHLAKADMSLARCWEGHVNSQILIAALGTAAQQERWCRGIVDRGDLWVSWSGEPQGRIPGQKMSFGTTVADAPGGYLVDGTKVFATSAGHADWAILLVNREGPGGARHGKVTPDSVLLLACDLSDSSVSFDKSWWDPIGMRGTVSYLARFEKTFIPAENLLGRPGVYMTDKWQTRFTPQYGATFLGAAEASYEYALDYVHRQAKEHDPYVQHRIAEMALHVESGHHWLRHVAGLWETGRDCEARSAGNKARFLLEQYAMETVNHAIRACGARCLNRPSPLERIYRDLSFYVRHDNADHVLAAIGREILGQPHDVSFFDPQRNGAAMTAAGRDTAPDNGEPNQTSSAKQETNA